MASWFATRPTWQLFTNLLLLNCVFIVLKFYVSWYSHPTECEEEHRRRDVQYRINHPLFSVSKASGSATSVPQDDGQSNVSWVKTSVPSTKLLPIAEHQNKATSKPPGLDSWRHPEKISPNETHARPASAAEARNIYKLSLMYKPVTRTSVWCFGSYDSAYYTEAPVEERPLLTLFTTFKDLPERLEIHNNTLHNWAALGPEVLPLLYVDACNASLIAQAKKLGWRVRTVPSTYRDIPIFRELFLDALAASLPKTRYYAFANGDILFDKSLELTLKSLSEQMDVLQDNTSQRNLSTSEGKQNNITVQERNNTQGLLVVGQRINVDLKHIGNPSDFTLLRKTAQLYGETFYTNAEDYFITTEDGLPWKSIPDFVIGRPGYDNWLVARANSLWHTAAVDTSTAILAVHQTGSDGNSAGWDNVNNKGTAFRNLKLARPGFNFHLGRTVCCQWQMRMNISSWTARLSKREYINKTICRRHARRKVYPRTRKGKLSYYINSKGQVVNGDNQGVSCTNTADNTSKADSSAETKPLLTLFTTMKDFPDRQTLHKNTLLNWAALAPDVQPLLYVDSCDSSLVTEATALKWHVKTVPGSFNGMPLFRRLFVDATTTSSPKTPFYMFAKGDLLFDESLKQTLEAINEQLEVILQDQMNQNNFSKSDARDKLLLQNLNPGLLVVGQRTNVPLEHIQNASDVANLHRVAADHGTLFSTNAEDYFITTEHGIPFDSIPNFVVGRPGYDNWLVAKASTEWKVTSVDASKAILAVHQESKLRPDKGTPMWDVMFYKQTQFYNLRLAGHGFQYELGHTVCCPWTVVRDGASKALKLVKRNETDPSLCTVKTPERIVPSRIRISPRHYQRQGKLQVKS